MRGFRNRLMCCAKALAVVALALSVVLAGCGAQATKYPQIGEKTEGSYDVVVTNGLSGDVTSLKVRVADTEVWGDELLSEEQTVAVGEQAELHVLPKGNAAAYDLMLVIADTKEAVEIDGVDLSGISEMTLCFEDGVGFVSFKSADGTEGSTKDAALAKKQAEEEAARKAEEEAKRIADEEAKRREEEEAARRAAEEEAARQAEEEAAAAAAAEEEYYSYDDSYEEEYYDYDESYYSEPSYTEDYSAPAQSDVDCTRENVILDN